MDKDGGNITRTVERGHRTTRTSTAGACWEGKNVLRPLAVMDWDTTKSIYNT